jgi:tetratricopeptide (TPR) repeat protein
MSDIYSSYEEAKKLHEGNNEKFASELNGLIARAESEGAGNWVLFFRSRIAGIENKNEEVIKLLDELIEQYKDSKKDDEILSVAKALYNKGVTLGSLGRSDEAIKVYDEVFARYKDSTETNLMVPVANALVNKGVTLGTLGRSDEEIKVYDEVFARYKDSTETKLKEIVADAHFNKNITLGSLINKPSVRKKVSWSFLLSILVSIPTILAGLFSTAGIMPGLKNFTLSIVVLKVAVGVIIIITGLTALIAYLNLRSNQIAKLKDEVTNAYLGALKVSTLKHNRGGYK